MGLHKNYLNGLLERFDAGEISCLITHLTEEPALELLFHEQFAALRHGQLAASLDLLGAQTGATAADVLTQAQGAVLEFVRHRVAELPGFATPVVA